jgi:ribonucleoside-diphosphate reductase alpha chain
MDYIFRYIDQRFVKGPFELKPLGTVSQHLEEVKHDIVATESAKHETEAMAGLFDFGDAPACSTCGAIMVRNGTCYKCVSCGGTSGCS